MALVALAIACLSAQLTGGDRFADEHARGVAANRHGGFLIRLKDGRTVFHLGERIQLELVYDQQGYALYMNRAYGSNPGKCARVHFDRPVAEHARIDASRFDGLSGGILGGVTSTPAVVQMALTDVYRFDEAGRYRLFVESRQITTDFETSNVLEFEILPRDRVWEAEVLERAKAALSGSQNDRAAVARAFAELRALGTNEATAFLARFFETEDSELPGRDEIWNALVSNPDRAFTVDALVSELTNPERRIGRWFIRRLAYLQLFNTDPLAPPPSHDDYLRRVHQLAITRSNALKTIPGLLETEIRRELGTFPSGESYFLGGGITTAARDFPQETTAAFRGLTAEAQRSRLVGTWRRFADPVFLPLVRSLYESPAEESDAVRDIALRRLYELAPEEGRSRMIAELRRDRPRVSIRALGMLPERAFPGLEAHWVQLLNESSGDVLTSAAQRLERFGTAKMAAPVERFYERAQESLACIARAALLGYIVRVDARQGERLLTSAATGSQWDDTCGNSLITEVADMEWSPAVERAAVAALTDPDLDFRAADGRVFETIVAQLLAQRGSTRVRRPLEARLEQVQSTIAAARRRSDASTDDEVWKLQGVEAELARAVNGARSWMLTHEEREQLDSRCSDASAQPPYHGCNGEFRLDENADPPDSVHVYPRIGDERQFVFAVGSYYGDSLRDLEQKLRQFPSGTRIWWNDWPDPGGFDSLERWTWSERDALFERFRRQAGTHGVILQRERKYIVRGESVCPE
jgi:hypothetical protein